MGNKAQIVLIVSKSFIPIRCLIPEGGNSVLLVDLVKSPEFAVEMPVA